MFDILGIARLLHRQGRRYQAGARPAARSRIMREQGKLGSAFLARHMREDGPPISTDTIHTPWGDIHGHGIALKGRNVHD